jgi:hypothetical protein
VGKCLRRCVILQFCTENDISYNAMLFPANSALNNLFSPPNYMLRFTIFTDSDAFLNIRQMFALQAHLVEEELIFAGTSPLVLIITSHILPFSSFLLLSSSLTN